MAIGNKTRQEVLNGLTLATTTEAQFVDAVTQLVEQVAENTDDIETNRQLNVTGDVQGTHTFHLDAPEDSELDIALTLTTDAIQTANIQDAQVTTPKIADDAVTLGTKTTGDYVATVATDNGLQGSGTGEGSSPTLGIADLGVTTAKLNDASVTNQKLADGTIANAKLANNTINLTGFGGGRDVTVALGATGTIPTFSGDSDGLVPGYNGVERRSSIDRALLSSDGAWYTVESWALSTSEVIPASRVATTGVSHTLSYSANATYPNTAAGARDYARESDNRTFALGRNDTVSVTESVSGTVYVFSYIGAGVNANTDAAAADFVSLGAVDAYSAGTGLSLSNNVFSISDGGVNTAQLAASAVTTAKINDDAVTTAKIADNAVTNAQLADDAVDSAEIADGAIDTVHIADGQVTSAKITNGTIVQGDLAVTGSVGAAGQLLSVASDGNFTWLEGANVIGDAVISYYDLTSVANQTAYTLPNSAVAGSGAIIHADGIYLHDSEDYTWNNARTVFTLTSALSAGKDIQVASFANANALGNGSVNGSVLVNNTVTAAQIADGAVGDDQLADISLGNWTLGTDGSGNLTFSHSGTIRMRLDTDGHLHTEDDITAFDSL